VYQTPPSVAGATSCGRDPLGTEKATSSSSDIGIGCGAVVDKGEVLDGAVTAVTVVAGTVVVIGGDELGANIVAGARVVEAKSTESPVHADTATIVATTRQTRGVTRPINER
jgi:hypothetical protein